MTAQTKGRIRHVALSVEDPWETAEFYKQAVGLQEVTELDGPLAEGVFLTDGVVNLAILHFKSDEAAQGTGKDFVGIHHIGFWVDDVVEQGKIARNAGATWIMGDPNNPHGYEIKHTDLNGIIFDIAAHGWAGSQKNPGGKTTRASQPAAPAGEVRRAPRAGPGEVRRDARERARPRGVTVRVAFLLLASPAALVAPERHWSDALTGADLVRFGGCVLCRLAGSAALQSRSWDMTSRTEERLWRAALPADPKLAPMRPGRASLNQRPALCSRTGTDVDYPKPEERRMDIMDVSPFADGAAYVKGRFVPIAEASIPVTDWGFTRSDAVYDVVHVFGGGFFRLDDHLDRFTRSMQTRRLNPPEDRAAIEAVLHRCVALAGLAMPMSRWWRSRGRPRVAGSRRPADCDNHFIAYALPWIDVIPKDVQERGAHLWIASTPRVPDASVDPTVKNYQWSDLTSGLLEAHDHGFDTADPVRCARASSPKGRASTSSW